jgi:uncharacterized protein YggL (DUF469 family)
VKKRLRKKLRLGEFQEFGFEVFFRLADNTPDHIFESVIDAFISHAIEANGLVCGGGGKNSGWNVFVTLDQRGSATDEHRQAVQRWLEKRAEVKDIGIGPLVDAWRPV